MSGYKGNKSWQRSSNMSGQKGHVICQGIGHVMSGYKGHVICQGKRGM